MYLASSTPRTVAICALTFQRPLGLARLLEGLGQLDPVTDGTLVRVVIIDNDPSGSGRAIVDAAVPRLDLPLQYEIEPRRGIATARNRAVHVAGDADIVVYIDDDEWPEPGWLNELLAVMDDTKADVVTGPVIPHLEPGAPTWVHRGRFFERPRFADRSAIPWATTSSVAMRLHAIGAQPFDPRFDRTGGEDTHLFARLRGAGARIIWADRAVVNELIPLSRCTPRWLVAREYRRGVTMSTSLVMLESSPSRRLKRVGRAMVEIGRGLALVPTSLVRGRAGAVRSVQRLAFGAGLITGMFGAEYAEYDTVHGR